MKKQPNDDMHLPMTDTVRAEAQVEDGLFAEALRQVELARQKSPSARTEEVLVYSDQW